MYKSSSLENNGQFSAIILAAGYSSRMEGKLKALLPLGEFTHLLHKVIDCFKRAHVHDIHLVLGHDHEKIREAIKDLGVCVAYNPHFDTGMYSSICVGIQSVLSKQTEQKASFVLPVDAALIKSDTLQTLMTLWHNIHNPANSMSNNTANNPASTSASANKFADPPAKDASILIPCFLKQCGHPPLIGRKHFSKILQYKGEDGLHGLRGYFASCLNSHARASFLQGHAIESSAKTPIIHNKEADTKQSPDTINFISTVNVEQSPDIINFISIADEGILSDIDTLADYTNAQAFLQLTANRQTASLLESWHLLQAARLPERIVKHSYQVALGALRLGLALQREEINPLYHICGGLLHDICRLQKNHASVGESFLQQIGWKELACIVGSHTALPKNILQTMDIHLHEPIEDISILPSEYDLHDKPACLYACICVYLADKFHAGENFVKMADRFLKVKERFALSPESLQAIDKREQVALAVSDWFYSTSKIQAEECVQTRSNHELETQLQVLYKMHYA